MSSFEKGFKGSKNASPFYRDKGFRGPDRSIHSPSNLPDAIPVAGGKDAASEAINSQNPGIGKQKKAK